jgi:hypothetical protein
MSHEEQKGNGCVKLVHKLAIDGRDASLVIRRVISCADG